MLWVKDIRVGKHKSIEFQLDWREGIKEWFIFNLETRTGCDHWGAAFSLALLNIFYFGITFYDHRHVDEEEWAELEEEWLRKQGLDSKDEE